jgi:hypothetical protein
MDYFTLVRTSAFTVVATDGNCNLAAAFVTDPGAVIVGVSSYGSISEKRILALL